MTDKLDKMFELREAFTTRLKDTMPECIPDLPIDIKSKAGQQFCRDITFRAVEELFEAVATFKNWKPHRKTEFNEFDEDHFLEEIVDSLNYIFELVSLAGFSSNDLYDAFIKKDKILHERINTGY